MDDFRWNQARSIIRLVPAGCVAVSYGIFLGLEHYALPLPCLTIVIHTMPTMDAYCRTGSGWIRLTIR